ncbi:MAG TPA: hypothetical protein VGQ22_06000 [Steroidobacteraceae bacterium]|nr:hypothetical protein [Steroidobacteraceae bacterium]
MLSREVIARIVKHRRAVEKPFFRPAPFDLVAVAELTANARTRTLAATLENRSLMVTAVVILTLLTVVASLASWLFGQWLAARTRISGAALAIGGGGVTLLVGTVAYLAIGASTWWQPFMPVFDSSPLIPPAAVPAPQAAAPADRKAEIRAAAERHLERSEFGEAIELARQYLATQPLDADMNSLLVRAMFAATHPGSAEIDPIAAAIAVNTEWPATDCVAAKYSDRTARWVLDNYCSGVVAVAFQSCEFGAVGCRSGIWRYEPAGILMTAANDKPVLLRVADKGPLVAPIFTIPDVAGTRRQIRYGACLVTAPRVLRLLRDSGSDEMAQQRLAAALRDDLCYSQVLRWSTGGKQLMTFSTGSQQ